LIKADSKKISLKLRNIIIIIIRAFTVA